MVKLVDFQQFIGSVNEIGAFWAVIDEPPAGSMGKVR